MKKKKKKILYVNSLNENKCTSFLFKNDQSFKKCNIIWNKIMQKEFDGQLMCNEKNLETKLKSYTGKVNINFQSKI